MLRKNFACVVWGLILAVATGLAFAEPVTYSSSTMPTFEAPSQGTPVSYTLYQGCDLANGTVGSVVDADYTSGKGFSFAGDTDSPPSICVVAVDSEGDGPFNSVFRLELTALVGPVINLGSGECQAVAGSSNVYTCSITVTTQ